MRLRQWCAWGWNNGSRAENGGIGSRWNSKCRAQWSIGSTKKQRSCGISWDSWGRSFSSGAVSGGRLWWSENTLDR